MCQLLTLRERAGDIRDLQAEDHVYLTDARILYVADFKFTLVATGEPVWAEAKGMETPEWRLKLRLWRHYGPGLLEIYKGSHLNPRRTEMVDTASRLSGIPSVAVTKLSRGKKRDV